MYKKVLFAFGIATVIFSGLSLVGSVFGGRQGNRFVGVEARQRFSRNRPSLSPSPTPMKTGTPTPKPSASPSAPPSPSASASPSSTPQSTTQPRTFGVVALDYANTNGELASVASKVNHPLSTVSIFIQFGNSNNSTLDPSNITYAKANNIKIQLAWEPWNPDQGMVQSIDYLKSIVLGGQDNYIKSFAQTLKTYGGPIVLRFGHEMNGDWYPWGKRPADYKAAYRYIHDLVMAQGVTNVTWEWSVNTTDVPSDLAQYYPGDDVVDVIGMDGFNWGTTQAYGGWLSMTSIFQPTYQYLTTIYSSKPIFISETASTEFGGDKAAWVRSAFQTELPKNMPKITEVIWFNLLKETDWRIDSSAISMQAFKDSLSI